MSLVVIENSTIARMASDPQFVQSFPCLKSARTVRRGCGRCGRKKTAGITDYADIKNCIAHLGHADKNKLKEMLGTDRIQVIYKSANSKAIKLTF